MSFNYFYSLLYSFILLLIILVIEAQDDWENSNYVKKEHSLTKPYQGSGMTIPNWSFFGNTMVTTSFIRLTPDVQSRQGMVWNDVPIRFRNWEIHVQFKVSGHNKDLYGDGMAFWYIKDTMRPGPIFGNADFFDGLGVFLDTYANQNGIHNHGHPYVSAMVNNGSLHYDHDRDGTHTEVAGCEAKFRGVEHDTHILIRYSNDVLTVKTNIEGKDEWKECFSVDSVRLPTGYYIGVTAATGDLSDNHDLISIKTYELEVPANAVNEDRSKIIPSAKNFAPHREHVPDAPKSMSGFKIFLIILCAIIGIVVCIIGGVFFYQRQQETSRKRFY